MQPSRPRCAAVIDAARGYVAQWATRHRDVAPEGTNFVWLMSCPRPQEETLWRPDDFPRAGIRRSSDAPQYGLASVVLSRQGLVGGLNVPLSVLAELLGLLVERSFGEVEACDIAYFETDRDAFTLVQWETSDYTEVNARIEPGVRNMSGVVGIPEFERFFALTGLSRELVRFPPSTWAFPLDSDGQRLR